MEIYKEYTFDSAHFLTKVPKEHPCSRLHGHTYVLKVGVEGEIKPNGFIIDYHEMDKIIKPLVNLYDHRLLNDLVDNPTVENLIMKFKQDLYLLPISFLELKETPKTGAIWRKSNELIVV